MYSTAFAAILFLPAVACLPATSIYTSPEPSPIYSLLPPASNISTASSTQTNVSCASSYAQESHEIGTAVAPAWPWQIYKSAPYNPPEFEVTTNGQPLAPGLLFITPSDASSQRASKENAVLIMTDAGQLVWNGPTVVADNFRIATFEGQQILTYWTGGTTSAANIGHGYGNVTFPILLTTRSWWYVQN